MTASTIQIVLTSAAVAALISAGSTFLNAHLERKSRRRELALSRALDLSLAMLDVARVNVSVAGLSQQIMLVHQDAGHGTV